MGKTHISNKFYFSVFTKNVIQKHFSVFATQRFWLPNLRHVRLFTEYSKTSKINSFIQHPHPCSTSSYDMHTTHFTNPNTSSDIKHLHSNRSNSYAIQDVAGMAGLPGVLSPEDLKAVAAHGILESHRLIEDIANEEVDAKHIIQTLDEISNELCKVGDAAELLRNVHPDAEWRDMGTSVITEISEFMGKVNVEKTLYDALEASKSTVNLLSEEEKLVLEKVCTGMEQQGVHMQPQQKMKCLQLLATEAQLIQEIVTTPVAEDEGVWLPKLLLEQYCIPIDSTSRTNYEGKRMAEKDKCVWVNGNSSIVHMGLRLVRDADVRKQLFYLNRTSDENADKRLSKLLECRQQLSMLRKYPNWNAFAQREGILRSPEAVREFLNGVLEALKPGLVRELNLLLKYKNELRLPDSDQLFPWDVQFLRQSYQTHNFGRLLRNIKNHLSVSNLLSGLCELTNQLFGLNLTRDIPFKGEVWHPSVLKYKLEDPNKPKGSQLLGILYIDLFAREHKSQFIAQYTIRCSKNIEYIKNKMPLQEGLLSFAASLSGEAVSGNRQTACTALVGSFTTPHIYRANDSDVFVDSTVYEEAVLSPSNALIFFHELGHTMHALISSTELQHLSGTRGAVDFAEFPSHLFEHFFMSSQFLSNFTFDKNTKSTMTADLIDGCRKIKNVFSHIDAMQLLLEAELDQAFHSFPCPPSNHSNAFVSKLFGRAAPTEIRVDELHQHLKNYFEDDKFHLPQFSAYPLHQLLGISIPSKFLHLAHYGGIYYCYLFCKATSSLIWSHAFQRNSLNATAGALLRKSLEQGSLDCSMKPIINLLKGAAAANSAAQHLKYEELLESPQHIPLEPMIHELEAPITLN